jgi:ribosomal protein S12 methylthiotransferase accessory factor
VRLEGEGSYLVSEFSQSLLQGRLHEQLAPLLNGQLSVEDIIDRLAGKVTAAEVYYVLGQLEQKGHLAEHDDLPEGESALWWLQDIDPRPAARRLAETAVSVATFGAVEAGPFQSVLHSVHVREGAPAGLGVVLADHYLRPGLRDYNRQALAEGRPWILVKPVGGQVWVGPIFRPGKTGCWECLAQRVRANRSVEAYLQKKQGSTEPQSTSKGSTPATLQIAWNLAATEIARWIARDRTSELEGKVLSLDVLTWQAQRHALVKQPHCPACGSAGPGRNGSIPPIVLQSQAKTFTEDGGHRVVRPETTLERYEHHVSPITGAVTLLARSGPASDGVLHVYLAGQNPATAAADLAGLRRGLRSSSAGKGASDQQAKASGLCEALERYSGVFQGDEPRRQARLRDLGEAGIHPNACMRFSDKQYSERADWNARKSHFNVVPVPFDEDALTDWSGVWSLTRQEVRYLPTAFCYFSYPEVLDKASCVGCSNGNAAGNTIEEAILQGFLELVERDSVALWWYNRVRRPAVDLDSFDDPYVRQVISFLGGRGRDLWALDLTADLEIPVFAALSRRTEGEAERIMIGFGAHLDPRIALLRAVTELNQMLAWVLGPAGEKPLSDAIDDAETTHWLQTATLANQPYLVPATVPARGVADFPRRWANDLKEDILACQGLVERKGMEMLVLDQTRADIGLPVVKVIVPGLRHFWARYAPGRLFDVPVELGWLSEPLAEDQLNPIPMFI